MLIFYMIIYYLLIISARATKKKCQDMATEPGLVTEATRSDKLAVEKDECHETEEETWNLPTIVFLDDELSQDGNRNKFSRIARLPHPIEMFRNRRRKEFERDIPVRGAKLLSREEIHEDLAVMKGVDIKTVQIDYRSRRRRKKILSKASNETTRRSKRIRVPSDKNTGCATVGFSDLKKFFSPVNTPKA